MTHWKVLLLPLAVLLPLLAYVAGTLSTGQERPTQPEPVILRNDGPGGGPASRDEGAARREAPREARDEVPGRGDDDDDTENGDNGRDDDDVEDDPEVVLPSPTRLDDGETDDDDGDVEDESDDEGGDD